MRRILYGLAALFFAAGIASAQMERDFSGSWRLNRSKSEIHDPAEPLLQVQQSGTSLLITAGERKFEYPLDSNTVRTRTPEGLHSTAAKWEGSALMVNTLVSSAASNYTIMERWRRSRDGSTLSIRRTLLHGTSESESTLVYEDVNAAPQSPEPQLQTREARPRPRPAPDREYLVPTGTRILLRLTNAVNTKHTAPGDQVYLQTAAPVYIDGRLVIPVGSYVTGTVTESKQSGRVKGKSALNLQFESLTLPSGTARDLRSRAGSADTRGNLDRKEGRIEGEGNKGGDARTVGTTTAAGTAIGAMAGHTGLGAAAGAAAGLAGVLGSRGPQVVLPAGTTMEMVLDHDLSYSGSELTMVR